MAKIKAETLLRKIQKGGSAVANTINTGVSKIPGINFNSGGGITMFRKREIVEPYLHPVDSRMVNEQVERAVKGQLKSVDSNIDENYSKFLPTHLVNDLYSLYYNPTNRLKFTPENETNKVKFGILDSINNSLIKIVTNNSHVGSYVYGEEIAKFLYKKFMSLPPEQQEKLKKALENSNQGGQNDQQGKQPQMGQGSQEGDGNEEGEEKKPGRPDKDQDGSGRQDSEGNEQSQRNGDKNGRGQANNSNGKGSQTDYSQEAADKMDQDLKNMVDMLNSKQSQKELEQAFKQAEQKLDKLKEVGIDIENDEEVPEEEKREIIRNLNNLDSIRSSLSRLNTSKEKVMKAVQKILNGTTNYFSQKCIRTDVELFEADQLLDINGIELLHPVFRKSRLFDLSVTERKYIGKFDLYIDCSGSMSSGCGGDMNGVPRIDLAKSLAMQMKELGILGDLYEFEDRPKKINNTDLSILMMSARGGTDIQKVVDNIVKTGNNSVVLSDGESHVTTYTHKALFIGVGTDFHYFKHYEGAGSQFVEEGQCIHYDGKDFVETEPVTEKKKQGYY
jgi:hypothetical protein